MARRSGPLIESLTVVASAALAGIACCGPIVIQWLGLLVWTVGGQGWKEQRRSRRRQQWLQHD